MKYILDFDGVIFNTKAFKNWLIDHGYEGHPRDEEMIASLKKDIASEILDMKAFVFEGARTFLDAYPNSTVLSSAKSRIDQNNEANETESIAFQEFKIAAVALPSVTQVQVVYDEKSEALREMTKDAEGAMVIFVDDTKKHLDDGKDVYENLYTVCMKRETTFKFGGITEHRVVCNFKELKHLVETLEEKEA